MPYVCCLHDALSQHNLGCDNMDVSRPTEKKRDHLHEFSGRHMDNTRPFFSRDHRPRQIFRTSHGQHASLFFSGPSPRTNLPDVPWTTRVPFFLGTIDPDKSSGRPMDNTHPFFSRDHDPDKLSGRPMDNSRPTTKKRDRRPSKKCEYHRFARLKKFRIEKMYVSQNRTSRKT